MDRTEQGRALSARVRAGSEVAPWVVPEIRALEDRIAALEGALRRCKPAHYEGECLACVCNDMPCHTLALIREVDELLTPQPMKEDA